MSSLTWKHKRYVFAKVRGGRDIKLGVCDQTTYTMTW